MDIGGKFMIVYGRNVATAYLQQPQKVRKVYVQEGFRDETLNRLLHQVSLPVTFCDKKQLDGMANGLHQGIVLEVEDYRYVPLSHFWQEENSFLLLLDHIEDPHNLGAIIRTAEAAGVDGVVLPKDRSASINATVVKTSVGTTLEVPICQVVNLRDTIQALKEHGYWIVGTTLSANSQDYQTIDYCGKVAIVIGNEGSGMSRLVQESCDFLAHIPMYGKVNSLNASVSAGIMIYEVLRQRRIYEQNQKQ